MFRGKISIIASLLSAVVIFSVLPAESATIAGTKCAKLGSIKIVSNIKYTCVTSGIKVIWNKGSRVATKPISAPSPTSTKSAVPVPTESQKPTPTPTTPVFVPPTAPTNWSDLIKNSDGIAYWAWKKGSEKIAGSTSKLGTINILISPNAVPDNPKPLEALNFVSRLVGNFEEPKRVELVYADEKDIDWGQTQIDQFCGQNECGYDVKGEAKKACNVPVTPCWGGLALRNKKTNVPMIYVTASEWGKKDDNHKQGTLEAHEYFHNVQQTLLADAGINRVPRWLIEGGATWVQSAAVFNTDFDKYLKERNRNSNDTLFKFKPDLAWLLKFLDPNYQSGWENWEDDKYEHWNVYDIGSLASEILVSMYGTATYLNLFKSVGAGKPFPQSFEELYGISWSQAAELIAKAIVAQQR